MDEIIKADKAPSHRISRITKREDLVKLAQALGVNHEWHANNMNGVSCKVFGVSFDNAGSWGRDALPVPPECVELYATLYKDNLPVAEVNLATLFSWSAMQLTADAQEIMLDDDHVFLDDIFMDWLYSLYPDADPAVGSFFRSTYVGQLPTIGYVFIQHSDDLYFLYIPQAKDPNCRILPVQIVQPTEEVPVGQVYITEPKGHVQIFEIMPNADKLLEDLANKVQQELKHLELSFIYEKYNHLLDFPAPEDMVAEAIDNHHGPIDWQKILEDLGEDLDEIASNYFSQLVQGNWNQSKPRRDLSDRELLEIAENHFDYDKDALLANALDSCDASNLLALADELKIPIPEVERQAMEQEAER